MKKVKEGYKMTELGEIPEEWEVTTLEDKVEIRSGNSPSTFNLHDNGIFPFYKVDDMNYTGKYLSKAKVYFDEEDYDLMPKGMVVFPKRGASIFTNKVAILENDGYFDTNIMGLKCKDTLNNEYLFYQLKFIELKRFADTTAVPQINNKHINPLKICLPPIKEQKKISSILSSVDEQIEDTDNIIEKTKELKKGLMQRLLTKGIGHEKFKDTEIGMIPKEWEVRKLSDLGEIITGNTPKTADKENYGLEYLWVSPIDMGKEKYITKTNKMLSKMGFEKTRKLPEGSILVTCIGSTIGKIGIAGCELSTNQQINSMICKSDYDNEFIYYAIDFNFSNYISYISTQAVPIINKTTFSEFQIQVPRLQEQKQIALILSSVDEKIVQYYLKKEKLQELKKGLMQKLLTGKIRVKI